MITKERLQELIEQGATIYFVYNGNVDLKEGQYKDDFILNETFVSIYWSTRSHQVEYEQLFETQEEAEWHKEFGCIERTERLELPLYEDIKDGQPYRCGFVANGKHYQFFASVLVIELLEMSEYEYCDEQLICQHSTKENYTIACRKCKELFLKGNIND